MQFLCGPLHGGISPNGRNVAHYIMLVNYIERTRHLTCDWSLNESSLSISIKYLWAMSSSSQGPTIKIKGNLSSYQSSCQILSERASINLHCMKWQQKLFLRLLINEQIYFRFIQLPETTTTTTQKSCPCLPHGNLRQVYFSSSRLVVVFCVLLTFILKHIKSIWLLGLLFQVFTREKQKRREKQKQSYLLRYKRKHLN